MKETGPYLHRFERALLAVDRLEAGLVLAEAGVAGSPLQAVEEVVVPALEHIGVQWERGEVALSQVYMSGRICEALVRALLPAGVPIRPQQPRLAIAVLEDFHLLGKNMVCSALRASGFEVIDYGHATVDELVRRVGADVIEVLLVSTLMLPSALRIKEVRRRLDALGRPVKIVVGGAPFRFDTQLWREVGADAVGQNALEAIELVRSLLKPAGEGEGIVAR